MKVILEIDDKYANILTVTAVGTSAFQTVVSLQAIDLSKHNFISLDSNGKWISGKADEDGK